MQKTWSLQTPIGTVEYWFSLIYNFIDVAFLNREQLQVSPYFGICVLAGPVFDDDDDKFSVRCVQYGGSLVNQLRLPPTLVTVGRLKYEAVPDFLAQMALPFSKRKA